MNESTDFKRTFTTALERGGEAGGRWDPRRAQHPPVDDLVAYRHRELAPADADAVQEHLAVCRPCAALVADMTAFPDLGEQPGEPSEHEVAQAWRRFAEEHRDEIRPQAGAADRDAEARIAVAPSAAAATTAAAPAPAPWHRTAVAWAAAACLALACVGLGTWNQRLEENNQRLAGHLAELRSPRPNVQLVDLGRGDTSRGVGTESDEEREAVPVGGDSWIILWFYPELEWDRYAADFEWTLADENGETVLSGDGLERGPRDFTLTLDRSHLPPGLYRLHLLGRPTAGGPAEELVRFGFQLDGE